jgi:hypothetical protein
MSREQTKRAEKVVEAVKDKRVKAVESHGWYDSSCLLSFVNCEHKTMRTLDTLRKSVGQVSMSDELKILIRTSKFLRFPYSSLTSTPVLVLVLRRKEFRRSISKLDES